MILAATGHRPDKLGGYGQEPKEKLYHFACDWVGYIWPEAVISGMALGWDTAVARAAVFHKIPLIAVLPFPQQASKWSTPDVMLWAELKRKASEVHVIAPEFSIAALQRRNEVMVDRAGALLVLWNGSRGGTANCINYAYRAKAEGKELKIVNCWEQWRLLGHATGSMDKS